MKNLFSYFKSALSNPDGTGSNTRLMAIILLLTWIALCFLTTRLSLPDWCHGEAMDMILALSGLAAGKSITSTIKGTPPTQPPAQV